MDGDKRFKTESTHGWSADKKIKGFHISACRKIDDIYIAEDGKSKV